MTVLTMNLFNDRADAAGFEKVIVLNRPHLVAVQELGPEAARVLERHYDHGLLRPQTDYNGIGLALSFEASVEEIETPEPQAVAAVARDPSATPASESMSILSVDFRLPFRKPLSAHGGSM